MKYVRGDGGTSVVAQSASTSAWVCESSQKQVLKKIKGGGRGKDRQQDRMSLQELLGCLVTRIGPQE